jgi:Ca2+:H+ antiporter
MSNSTDTASPYFLKWIYIMPVAGIVVFLMHHSFTSGIFFFIMTVAVIGSVLAAVQHAEIVSHRIGEPLGSVVLAVAVTIIEVSLIVSLMFSGKASDAALARDTVFAAVMIILNGMVGLCILTGGIKYGEQNFGLQGISSALTILVAISIFTLVLPNYTVSVPGPFYNNAQLIFVGIVTLVLYATFIGVQNFKHKKLFVEPNADSDDEHERPTKKEALFSLAFLIICLAAVVLLAEALAPGLEKWVATIGAPHSLVGVIIAIVVLLPEGISAIHAARNNKLQKSLNLSLGSALASIGLTIPTISIIAVFTGMPLTLGIDVKSTVLFLLSLLVIILSLSTGKTTILQGVVLLIIFSVYLFMIVSP